MWCLCFSSGHFVWDMHQETYNTRLCIEIHIIYTFHGAINKSPFYFLLRLDQEYIFCIFKIPRKGESGSRKNKGPDAGQNIYPWLWAIMNHLIYFLNIINEQFPCPAQGIPMGKKGYLIGKNIKEADV